MARLGDLIQIGKLFQWLTKSDTRSFNRNTMSLEGLSEGIAAVRTAVDVIPTTSGATQASVDTIDGIVDAILVDTDTTIPGLIAATDGKIDTVDGIVDDILEDTGTTLPASIDALPTAAEIESEIWGAATADYTTAGTFGKKLADLTSGGASDIGLAYKGTCDAGMSASATTIVSADLAGYGDDFFNGKYWLTVLKNDNSVGNAPEQEYRKVTDYTSASGTVVCDAFSANVEADDTVMLVHESIPFTKVVEFTSGSGIWTVPAGTKVLDEVLLVAGGGGGEEGAALNGSGGGGGGEVVLVVNMPVVPGGSVAYSVGAGGAGGTGNVQDPGDSGGNTTFGKFTAAGGEGGGVDGGCFGGDGGGTTGGAGAITLAGNGSDGTYSADSLVIKFGGGGGGGGNNNDPKSGDGGAGYEGAGGTGPSGSDTTGGGGGSWGAGANGVTSGQAGASAAANTGGGGSGGSLNADGGNGGSGYIRILWRA